VLLGFVALGASSARAEEAFYTIDFLNGLADDHPGGVDGAAVEWGGFCVAANDCPAGLHLVVKRAGTVLATEAANDPTSVFLPYGDILEVGDVASLVAGGAEIASATFDGPTIDNADCSSSIVTGQLGSYDNDLKVSAVPFDGGGPQSFTTAINGSMYTATSPFPFEPAFGAILNVSAAAPQSLAGGQTLQATSYLGAYVLSCPAPLPPPPSPTTQTLTFGPSGGPGPSGGSGSASAKVGQPNVAGTVAGAQVSCVGSAGSSCMVTLTLTVVEKLKGGKVVAVSAAKHKTKSKRTVVVGSSNVTLAAEQSETVKVALNGTGKRLLASRHNLPVNLTASQSGGASSTLAVTFKAAKKAKHH
jgi:hypothetical protein